MFKKEYIALFWLLSGGLVFGGQVGAAGVKEYNQTRSISSSALGPVADHPGDVYMTANRRDTVFTARSLSVSASTETGLKTYEKTEAVEVSNEPQIEYQPGWPVYTESYHFPGQGVYAEIDVDYPGLEIAFAVYGTRPGLPLVDWTRLYVLHEDGTPVGGFDPYFYIEEPTQSVSVFDIDPDGQVEFVLVTGTEVETGGNPPMLHVIELTGEYRQGFPFAIASWNVGAAGSWPVLADLNNDVTYEIIVSTNSGSEHKLHVFNPDGSYFLSETGIAPWPLTLEGNVGTPAVANLDTDADLEIVVAVAPAKVNVYNLDATLQVQMTVDSLTNAFTPSIGDVDGDGQLDIVVGAGRAAHPGKIYVFSHKGELKSSWNVNCAFPHTVSLGDFDTVADGLEVLTAAGYNCPYIEAFHWDGTPIQGWPVVTDNDLDNPVAIADIDNDFQSEVLVSNGHDGGTPHLFIRRFDGSNYFDSPLDLVSRSKGPSVGYIDSDPALEIIQSDGNYLAVYEYRSCGYPVPGGLIYWPMEGANARHTGLYTVPVIEACCIGIRGNVNGDSGEQVNIADLTYLVDYLFRGCPAPPCREEGNVDGDPDENINVADLTYLVDYLFRGGPAPPPCP